MRKFCQIAGVGSLSLVCIVACAPSLPHFANGGTSTDVISAEEISHLATSNAWELLRKRARQYDFTEDQFGRPVEVRVRRGRSTISVASADTPIIIVDGARVIDLGFLRDLSSESIESVELLSGISGTVAQGTNASAGVIYIHTWDASQRL
jgi:TonB-dependent receptor-like protein